MKKFKRKRSDEGCAPSSVVKRMIGGRRKDLDEWFYRSVVAPTIIVHGLKDLEVGVNEADELEKVNLRRDIITRY